MSPRRNQKKKKIQNDFLENIKKRKYQIPNFDKKRLRTLGVHTSGLLRLSLFYWSMIYQSSLQLYYTISSLSCLNVVYRQYSNLKLQFITTRYEDLNFFQTSQNDSFGASKKAYFQSGPSLLS
ncbi:hypothetical protein BpHYR1_001694 [Brachionus plicatilis]|uniref:Uncharacterized protein n=1 Tax=Brachionus plicatilis TaxID=10195 RepID=A0A3M7T047_BRAPC|nr:hypothetical protein BpHYR1_001694 [Brachionus plicatilis]